MRFSIIIPSFLGSYAGAASNREQKILRAVASVQYQTFQDFEIIVVADGCQRTIELMNNLEKVRSIFINRTKLWSGAPRNAGLTQTKGKWVVYLDIDDMYGENHLKTINEGLNGFDWVWYNDIRYKKQSGTWYENECDIRTIGRHGTSNICHKKELNVNWDFKGYAHDYYFVQNLLRNKNFGKISCPEYYVMHIPGIYDL